MSEFQTWPTADLTSQKAVEAERVAIMAWIRAQTCDDTGTSVLDCEHDGLEFDPGGRDRSCDCYAYQTVAEMIRGRGTGTKEGA